MMLSATSSGLRDGASEDDAASAAPAGCEGDGEEEGVLIVCHRVRGKLRENCHDVACGIRIEIENVRVLGLKLTLVNVSSTVVTLPRYHSVMSAISLALLTKLSANKCV